MLEDKVTECMDTTDSRPTLWVRTEVNKAMAGTRGVDEEADEKIWVSLGYFYIPEWIFPCMLKLEKSIWVMLVLTAEPLAKYQERSERIT